MLGIEGVLGIGTMVGLEAELPNPNASALPEVASELGAGATATNESNCDAGDVPRSLEAPLVSE